MDLQPHRALSCYDVLSMIFEHFEREDTWYDHDTSIGDGNAWFARRADIPRRRCLARCGRVCKDFFFPAITILWRHIDSLSPFLSTVQHQRYAPRVAPQVGSESAVHSVL